MPPLVAFERLLVAALIGILIGLDRERAEERKAHRLFAGVRTFPLIALTGAVSMLLLDVAGIALVITSFAAVAAVTCLSYVRASAAGSIGATTEIAALATFLLGVLAGAGELLVAAGTGVAIAVLLVAKLRLEAFSRALSQEELAAVLELAVISVIVLPLVPNQGYGPWEVLNPFEIWLVVVLVSALSFAGFVAMRLFGAERGTILAGVLGALVSSTAVTVAMATQARANRQLAAVTAAAAVLASAIMCVRVAVLVGAVHLALVPRLLPVVVAMLVAGIVPAVVLAHRAPEGEPLPSGATIRNPFSLTSALTFGLIYAVVLLAARLAHEYLGTGGVYLAAAVSALADVDAVAIAFARLGAAGGGVAVEAIAVAMVTNTLVKMGIAVVMSAGRFRWYVGASLSLMAVAGAGAALLV